MGKKTLKQQMFFSIDNGFTPGVSKHNLTPGEAESRNRIHSYSYRDNLRDTASEFSKFCRDNFGVKFVKEITQEQATAFIEEKTKTCSSQTVAQYCTRLDKISKVCEDTFGNNLNWHCKAPENTKHETIRDIAMSRDDYTALEKRMSAGRECDSKYAVMLSEAFGLRVSETVKITPNDIKQNILHIHQSKGGRDRDIKISTQHQQDILDKLQEYRSDCEPNERILKVQSDSVNAYLHNNLKALGNMQYEEHSTGIHSIRKMYATEQYEARIDKGMSHQDAWGEVSVELGHSANREDLFEVYVKK